MKTALITGADRGLGLALVREYLNLGYTVFAGRFLADFHLLDDLKKEWPDTLHPVQLDVESRASILAAAQEVAAITDHLDVFVSDAAYMGGPENSRVKGEMPIDESLLEKAVAVNALGALQCVEILLPLLRKGEEKRLCIVSSEVSSVTLMQRDGDFRYCMSKTALNVAVRMLQNTLASEGFTFRLYQPGWMRRQQPDGSFTQWNDCQINAADSAKAAIPIFTSRRPDDAYKLELVDYLGSVWPF